MTFEIRPAKWAEFEAVMVAPIGATGDVQRLVRITRDGDAFHEEALLDVRFVPLVHGLGRADG